MLGLESGLGLVSFVGNAIDILLIRDHTTTTTFHHYY